MAEKLANCAYRTGLAHITCHGWQIQYTGTPPYPILICSCKCGHDSALSLVESGALRLPPGYNREQFRAALTPNQQREQR